MPNKTCTLCNKTLPASKFHRMGSMGPIGDKCEPCFTRAREGWRKRRSDGALLCKMAGSRCSEASASMPHAAAMLGRASRVSRWSGCGEGQDLQWLH